MKIRVERKDKAGRLTVYVLDTEEPLLDWQKKLLEEEKAHGRALHDHRDQGAGDQRGSG